MKICAQFLKDAIKNADFRRRWTYLAFEEKEHLFNDKTIYKEYYNFFKESVKKAREGGFIERN